jgi:hypothetical protein
MLVLPVCRWSSYMIPLSEPLSESPAAGPVPPPPGSPAGSPEAEAAASGRLPAMRARFLADFTSGRMGQHHNTFQHRERILRQLAQPRRGG